MEICAARQSSENSDFGHFLPPTLGPAFVSMVVAFGGGVP
jgi:hypothetical protein